MKVASQLATWQFKEGKTEKKQRRKTFGSNRENKKRKKQVRKKEEM